MKKILLAAAMVMAINLPVNATELPNVDLSGFQQTLARLLKVLLWLMVSYLNQSLKSL